MFAYSTGAQPASTMLSMQPQESTDYVLGTGDDELVRLGFQHRLWSSSAAAIWERAGFCPGDAVLDLGCGPGYTTFDLAELVGGTGSVLGVELSRRFVEHCNAQAVARGVRNVEAREMNVEQLDVRAGGFDRAFARWVLCFVGQPEAVVAGVARGLRRGGTFAVQDYVFYQGISLSPESEAFRTVIRAVDKSWRLRGGDPDVAGRLPGMLARQGFSSATFVR